MWSDRAAKACVQCSYLRNRSNSSFALFDAVTTLRFDLNADIIRTTDLNNISFSLFSGQDCVYSFAFHDASSNMKFL